MDFGLLIARLVLGLGIGAHGAQKLFGWFDGVGPEGSAAMVERLGFQPGTLFGMLVGLCEFAAGVLLVLGLLGPVGPALVLVVMTTAMLTVHVRHGFFNDKYGVELPLVYSIGVMLLALFGPGYISADYALGLMWLSTPMTAWVTMAVGVAVALLGVAIRRPQHVERPATV